jgi:RNA polymerase sigma-70 factor (ECF subfamily)
VVRRVKDGESPLFAILVQRYRRRLYGVARAMLGDAAEAEDVMQHTCVAAFAHLDQYAARARFSRWLTRIAVHEALARLRRRDREVWQRDGGDARPDPFGALQSPGPDPEQHALARERQALLESAVADLPSRYRDVFVLRAVRGLTTTEAARLLQVSGDVVKTRLHRARSQLRAALRPHYGAAGVASTFRASARASSRLVTAPSS